MLTNKERAKLRSLASKIKSVFNVGKEGLKDNILTQIDLYLEAHELIKISILENADMNEKDAAYDIANKLKAIVVETKGSTVVLYRKSNNKKGKGLL